jgi:hypothetical protein
MIYKTHEQAYKHAQKLRAQHNDDGIMVRVEHSPYGGFRVRLVAIDLMVDRLIDNPQNISNHRSTAFC